jgi:hypothetical protein
MNIELSRTEILRYLGSGKKSVPAAWESVISGMIDTIKTDIRAARYIFKIFDVRFEGGAVVLGGAAAGVAVAGATGGAGGSATSGAIGGCVTGVTDGGATSGTAFFDSSIVNHLKGCKGCAVLAATLGVEADNKIKLLQRVNMADAVIYDACANEYIEKVCDACQAEIALKALEYGCGVNYRFSPGYGDFKIENQRVLIGLLNAEKRLGLHLSENNLLIPQKSVTAIIGFIDGSPGCVSSAGAVCGARGGAAVGGAILNGAVGACAAATYGARGGAIIGDAAGGGCEECNMKKSCNYKKGE